MAKIFAYVFADGSCRQGRPNLRLIPVLTGSGFVILDEAREVEKAVAGGKPEALATEWFKSLNNGGLTELQAYDVLARWMAPDGVVAYHLVEVGDDHKKDEFYNATIFQNGGFSRDMVKARTIAQDRIREVRSPRFAHWDAQWNKAQEDNDAAAMATIKANRQKLRDAPADPRIANAANETSLKAAMQSVIVELP